MQCKVNAGSDLPMNNLESTAIALRIGWPVVLALSPLCGWLLANSWQRLSGRWRKTVLVTSFLSLALVSSTLFAQWALRGFWANAVNLGLAYVLLSALIWLACKKAPGLLRIAAPLLANLTCTIPILIFIVLVRDEIPVGHASFGGHLVARIYERGFTGNDFDLVVVVEQPHWLPFMEKTLREQSIWDGDCITTTARLVPTSTGNAVQVICGQRAVETINAP